ncbi:related to RRP1 - involved in processing rRNA precursor species to mature rRNAs [Ustilago trichophora]|uniref:Related to RRP1 - involved in processing rRNA species to mature rRNAs n=1 Tax=Ustilago trichophora TaxID=86804 RepID=A0A5C3EJ76_9BASI|nr:related to RRP1 - involved in processing rRNA precursor species to mature rRNAs [Ustilago trichophora]
MPATSSKAAAVGSKRKTSAGGAIASGSKAKKSKSGTSSSSSSAEDASIPLGKALASTEKRIRDGAVRSLTAYLAANGAHTIPDLELQKLWKGLFYCFWMSDKPLIQQRLANDLANLVLVHPSTPPSSSSSSSPSSTAEDRPSERAQGGLKFLETFWDTLIAEWSGLDKHRMDKFYLLVRRFVASGFQLLAEEKWHPAAVRKFQEILGKFEGGVLSTNNPKVPDSLTYHLSDIYLGELEKVVELVHDSANEEEMERLAQQEEQGKEGEQGEEEEEEEDLPLVPTLELLMPFVDALATAKSKAMYDRIWSNVFEPLLEDTLRASARHEDDFASDDEQDFENDAEIAEEEEEDAEEEEEGGDETANGTEFHSFADESAMPSDSDSEPSIPDSDDEEENEEEEDGEGDVQFPLLLALSAVPTPQSVDQDDEELEEEDVDVALVLRKAIFQALFKAASRKDATEARRRLLYQLWRDEQDRLNDLQDGEEDKEEEEEDNDGDGHDDDDDDDDEDDEDEE